MDWASTMSSVMKQQLAAEEEVLAGALTWVEEREVDAEPLETEEQEAVQATTIMADVRMKRGMQTI